MAEAVEVLDNDKKRDGIGKFVQETRSELNKTTFPSSDDVKKTTIIVVISVVFFAIYLFVVDYLWVYLLEGINWLVNTLVGI